MINEGRRRFLTRYAFQLTGRVLRGFSEGVRTARQEDEFDEFFSSYESSYALTLAYPDEILLETARRHGIPTEGRSKNEIVKELFLKTGGFENRL
jgi:hypothetical protein